MNKHTWLSLTASCLAALLVTAGCSKKEETATQEAQSAQTAQTKAATPIDLATAATVKGSVKFEGTAPKPKKIDMSQDPACAATGKPNFTEAVVTEGGKLANVFVYVKEGLGDRAFAPPSESAVIDQHDCRYRPHVLGTVAGQNVEIKNSDPTTHNIHPSPKINREWNESQAPKASPLEKVFAREEIMLPVKCNQHPWMKMYINVVKNPFFAVTDKDGNFEIKGLPPGTYTIAAVQETLGEQTAKVTVGAKETKTADFSFKPGAGAGGQ